MSELFTLDEVLEILADAVDDAGGVVCFADQIGVTNQYVSAVMRRKQAPGPAMLRGLGLRKEVRYVVMDGAGDEGERRR